MLICGAEEGVVLRVGVDPPYEQGIDVLHGLDHFFLTALLEPAGIIFPPLLGNVERISLPLVVFPLLAEDVAQGLLVIVCCVLLAS